MREPWLTLTAGLVGGAALVTFATLYVAGGYTVAVPAGGFYLLASGVLAWMRPRPLSVLAVWLAAVCLLAVAPFLGDEQELWGTVLLSSVVMGTVVSVPWLLVTGALRLLLADPATRPSYDLDELHS